MLTAVTSMKEDPTGLEKVGLVPLLSTTMECVARRSSNEVPLLSWLSSPQAGEWALESVPRMVGSPLRSAKCSAASTDGGMSTFLSQYQEMTIIVVRSLGAL